MGTDWVAWHEAAYGTDGPLRRCLEVVRRSVSDAASRAAPGAVRILSICAGDGREVIGGLAGHRRASDAHVLLVENDSRLAAAARLSARAAGLAHVEVMEADAGMTTAYDRIVPADVVVASGLFSHLSDMDVQRTIETLPLLCDRNAFVIWTRDRSQPDLTPSIREWFVQAGFQDLAYSRFVEGDEGVGMARLAVAPRPFRPDVRMFQSLIDRSQSGRSAGSTGEMRSG